MNKLIRKQAVRIGNSAGVLLPKEWMHYIVEVKLIQPVNVEGEVLEILRKEKYLNDVRAVALVGSYARGEQTARSDVDVLIITKDIDKIINRGKYNLLFVSLAELNNIERNPLPVLPMLRA